MHYREVSGDREFVARLAHGEDWRTQIEEFAADEEVSSAFFFGLGAVKDATIFYYDQTAQEYQAVEFDEPLEVATCVGNVSELEEEPFAHTHAILSREDGTSVSGHLDAATTFAGEVYVRTFDTDLVREHDQPTDLDLWEL